MTDYINLRQLIKELSPDQLGMFEPLSGLMLLNIAEAEFQALVRRWQANECTELDVELLSTINHETYHFIQTIASGYMYDRQYRLFAELNRVPFAAKFQSWGNSLLWSIDEVLFLLIKRFVGSDQESIRRIDNMMLVMRGNNQLAWWRNRTQEGDYSWAGVLFPHFFRYQEELAAREAEENGDGLSILGVLEGSAVIHTQLLMGGNEGAQGRIEAELEKLPAVYNQMYALTKRYCGDRTIEFLLPTAALALQYTRPHDAYLPLLNMILANSLDDPFEAGRKISENLPNREFAGGVLGTAIDVHWKSRRRYKVYSEVLQELATGKWGMDSYTLLALPEAMNRVPGFRLGLVTNDGYHPGMGMDLADLGARMAIMAGVLRVASRRREERRIEKGLVSWGREVFGLYQ